MTGPSPSATDMMRSPSTTIRTTASETVIQLAIGIETTPLHHHAETVDVEEMRNGAKRAAGQQFEARIRPLIGIAFRLALLDDLDELVETGSSLPTSMPRRFNALRKFDLPPWSDTMTLRKLPTDSGSTCS